jgi:hypothetical protein
MAVKFRVPGSKRPLLALLLVLLLQVMLSCDGDDDSSSTTWSGTYTVPDDLGGGSGTVSFLVESNDTIFCFKFSGSQSVYSTACNNPATESFPINGNQFSIPVTSMGQGAFTLTGQFTSSSTQATGNIRGPAGSDDSHPVLSWSAAALGGNKM